MDTIKRWFGTTVVLGLIVGYFLALAAILAVGWLLIALVAGL